MRDLEFTTSLQLAKVGIHIGEVNGIGSRAYLKWPQACINTFQLIPLQQLSDEYHI